MPLILFGLIATSAIVYTRGAFVLRRRAGAIALLETWRVVAFAAGQVTLAIAAAPALERLAEQRFPAHMFQHELLLLVAPILLALGRPGLAMLWALPGRARGAVACGLRAAAPAWRAVTNVPFLFVVHGVVVWSAHWPALFNTSLAHPAIHAAQHAVMLLTAALFWWSLVEGRSGKLGYGAAAAFVFATSLHTGLLGAGLTFARSVLYSPYETAATSNGFDGLRDQQLAGLLMWIPAGFILTVLGLALVAAWIGASEHRAQVNEGP